MIIENGRTYIPAKGSDSPYDKDDHQIRLVYLRYLCSWHPKKADINQHKKHWIDRILIHSVWVLGLFVTEKRLDARNNNVFSLF